MLGELKAGNALSGGEDIVQGEQPLGETDMASLEYRASPDRIDLIADGAVVVSTLSVMMMLVLVYCRAAVRAHWRTMPTLLLKENPRRSIVRILGSQLKKRNRNLVVHVGRISFVDQVYDQYGPTISGFGH